MEREADTTEHSTVVDRDLRMAACGLLLVDPDDIDFDADLMKLGFDSVTLVHLLAQVGETYGIDLDPVIVFDHPSLGDLARYLMTAHSTAVAERIDRADEPTGGGGYP